MSQMDIATCSLCSQQLTRQHPRYVLNFEQCGYGSCLRKRTHGGTEASCAAPLSLPGAETLQQRAPVPSDRHFSCHLCLDDASGPSLGYYASELCEHCHHTLTSKQTRNCFTDGLTQINTGSTSKIWVCDGCGAETGQQPFVLPFFACSKCAFRAPPHKDMRRSLLWGLLMRLPANLDIHSQRLPDLFTAIPAAMLSGDSQHSGSPGNAGPEQGRHSCSACGDILGITAADVAYCINYALCAGCREVPPAEVTYHFKGMFKRCRADGLQLQRYTSTKQQLGMGGFGDVFRVKGEVTGQMYAQKVVKMDRGALLRARHGNEEEQEETFKSEARMLRRCCHPNIVECFEAWYCRSEGNMYIVLEEAPHKDLQHLLAKRRGGAAALDEAKVWFLLRQIAAGLAYLHDRCIVHRDLKPNNVLLFQDEAGCIVAKLTDFGLARMLSERVWREAAEHSGTDSASAAAALTKLGGTPFYIAPELMNAGSPFANVKATRQSDVWALGVVLWEMAYSGGGSPLPHPFRARGNDWRQVNYRELPQQPINVVPRSSSLQQLITWMLCPNPKQRPNIGEVLLRAKAMLSMSSIGLR